MLKKIYRFFADILFPDVCCICGEITRGFLDGKSITANFGGKEYTVPYCRSCARRLQRAFGPWKRKTRIRNSTAYYLFDYSDETVKRMIRHIKTHQCKKCINFLARISESCLDPLLSDGSTLTFIPRNRKLLAKYGFDQTKCVAEEYVKLHPRTSFEPLICRGPGKFRDIPQKLLNREQRFENAKSALSLKEGVHIPQSVVLFDDMITTGATADSASALIGEKPGCTTKLFFLTSSNLIK